MSYTKAEFDNDFKLFSAAYATNLLNQNVTEAVFLNKSIIDNILFSEAQKLPYNETAIILAVKSYKENYLKNNLIQDKTYEDNYKVVGFSTEDIDAYLYKEILVSYYSEAILADINVTSEEVFDVYNNNLNLYTYNDSFYIFKVIILDNKTNADTAKTMLLNYNTYFNLSNATAAQKLDAKNYLFQQLLMQNSLDYNKYQTRGIYPLAKNIDANADEFAKFVSKPIRSMTIYDVSDVLEYNADAIDPQTNQSVKVKRFYLFEKLPNILSIVDAGDDIYNRLLLYKKTQAWNNYLTIAMQTHNLTFVK